MIHWMGHAQANCLSLIDSMGCGQEQSCHHHKPHSPMYEYGPRMITTSHLGGSGTIPPGYPQSLARRNSKQCDLLACRPFCGCDVTDRHDRGVAYGANAQIPKISQHVVSKISSLIIASEFGSSPGQSGHFGLCRGRCSVSRSDRIFR